MSGGYVDPERARRLIEQHERRARELRAHRVAADGTLESDKVAARLAVEILLWLGIDDNDCHRWPVPPLEYIGNLIAAALLKAGRPAPAPEPAPTVSSRRVCVYGDPRCIREAHWFDVWAHARGKPPEHEYAKEKE